MLKKRNKAVFSESGLRKLEMDRIDLREVERDSSIQNIVTL